MFVFLLSFHLCCLVSFLSSLILVSVLNGRTFYVPFVVLDFFLCPTFVYSFLYYFLTFFPSVFPIHVLNLSHATLMILPLLFPPFFCLHLNPDYFYLPVLCLLQFPPFSFHFFIFISILPSTLILHSFIHIFHYSSPSYLPSFLPFFPASILSSFLPFLFIAFHFLFLFLFFFSSAH